MTNIVLTRKQIEQLTQIANHFKEIEQFNVVATSESGIGQTIRVSFDLFNTADTNIDITDVENW